MSGSITVLGHAKINLALDILGKREDGYHEVQMIMQSVSLSDEITVSSAAEGISVVTNRAELPGDSTNLAYRAAELVKTKFHIPCGVHINLTKKIPLAAGLAGGSTDAAAVLKGLNKLWNLGLSRNQLEDLGAELGSDVPFCLFGGTMLATGRGEKVVPCFDYPDSYVALAKPEFSVSTAWVYQNYQANKVTSRPDIPRLIQMIEQKDISKFARHTANVLESVTLEKYPLIGNIKKAMLASGAQLSLMSGSGPTVFGLFESKEMAEKAALDLNKTGNMQIYVAKTLKAGGEYAS